MKVQCKKDKVKNSWVFYQLYGMSSLDREMRFFSFFPCPPSCSQVGKGKAKNQTRGQNMEFEWGLPERKRELEVRVEGERGGGGGERNFNVLNF